MSQSLSNILLHIVFSTKNREKFIDTNIEDELHKFLVKQAASGGNYVYNVNGVEDHVHLMINLHKTGSVSSFIEDIKKNSSRWIKSKGNQYQSFTWQKGYGAFSVSQTHKDLVAKYIMTQKEHHSTITFQDEYRNLLNKNGVIFDERYVWD